jgi:hypothetical protein
MTEHKIEETTNVLKDESNPVLHLSSLDPIVISSKSTPDSETKATKNDPEKSGANLINITKGEVLLNSLTPREQEREGISQ